MGKAGAVNAGPVEARVERGHWLLVAAAITAGDARAAASHESAALVHGLDLIGKPGDLVHLTRVPRDRGSRASRRGVRIHVAELPGGHLVRKDGVTVTSVARTVVDLARVGSFVEGVVVSDSALRSGKTTVAEMQAVIADCGSWPGVKQARRVVEFSDSRSESALESIGRVKFAEQGLPPPALQVWVGATELGTIGRVDFLWAEQQTIAEADGAVKYATPSRAIAQLDRDARLRDAGFEVVHFTWDEITMAPWQVAARIRAAFSRAAQG